MHVREALAAPARSKRRLSFVNDGLGICSPANTNFYLNRRLVVVNAHRLGDEVSEKWDVGLLRG